MARLLTVSNMKTVKGEGRGYRTFILHLAPSTLSGYNTCPMASKGCAAACLNTAGRGVYANTQNARIRKTRYFFENRDAFMLDLAADIATAIRRTEKAGLIPVFRLNGTSDIRWENIPIMEYRNIMEMFPNVQFYDYTKLNNRRNLPHNYALTFSRSESNADDVDMILNGIEHVRTPSSINIAVVFNVAKGDALPASWMGRKVIDGDVDDLRFLDPHWSIVGLRGKGKAYRGKRGDFNGFLVNP
jgi:hypothetical protein